MLVKPDKFLLVPDTGLSVKWLAASLSLSPEEVLALFELGAVYADGERVFSLEMVTPGQTLRVFPSPLRFSAHLLTEESILFESEDYIAVDKPAGVPSVPVASNAIENALERARQLTGLDLFPAHRLDEATRGVLLMARSAEAVHGFQKLQRAGKVLKIYKALTLSEVPQGLHEHWMTRGSGRMEVVEGEGHEDSKSNSSLGQNEPSYSSNHRQTESLSSNLKTPKLARLNVHSSEEVDGHWLTTIQLLTGRTHQIRCQLAHLGCPIVGDSLYGTAEPNGLMLQAWRLEFGGIEIISNQTLTL